MGLCTIALGYSTSLTLTESRCNGKKPEYCETECKKAATVGKYSFSSCDGGRCWCQFKQ
ncbi:hypothetical protein C0J52_05024 [Blattella germanica]|nr:hypothetical protein C0J52_05024 [Blattella germanica]